MSTGHAATETFSLAECYELPDGSSASGFRNISWTFESDQLYGDTLGPLGTPAHRRGLSPWYASLKGLPYGQRHAQQMDLAERVVLADMLLNAAEKRSRTVVDLGHHINLGVAGALAKATAGRADFIRVIRHRYDTVRSFLAEGWTPCGNGMFILCPLRHPGIQLAVDEGVWTGELSSAQRLLWFVDEVEARWQHLLSQPYAPKHLTVKWCSSDQLQDAWRQIAAYIGVGHQQQLAPAAICNQTHHTHGQTGLSDAQLGAQDAEYKKLMGYSEATLDLIRDVQRPHDCEVVAPSRD